MQQIEESVRLHECTNSLMHDYVSIAVQQIEASAKLACYAAEKSANYITYLKQFQANTSAPISNRARRFPKAWEMVPLRGDV